MLLAAATQGYLLKTATWIERGILLVASLLLIKPGLITDLVGLGLLIVVGVWQFLQIKRRRA